MVRRHAEAWQGHVWHGAQYTVCHILPPHPVNGDERFGYDDEFGEFDEFDDA
jgi:hypothetical protein